ncbi:hypothetical protein ACIBVL_24975 [Streptomyces sp. NPDC049687]|uniref:hypothetical protein n=1 Tax=Streptomyces sp. NPDC049687 TaxID=3365596 RepID=UPI003796AD81
MKPWYRSVQGPDSVVAEPRGAPAEGGGAFDGGAGAVPGLVGDGCIGARYAYLHAAPDDRSP